MRVQTENRITYNEVWNGIRPIEHDSKGFDVSLQIFELFNTFHIDCILCFLGQ